MRATTDCVPIDSLERSGRACEPKAYNYDTGLSAQPSDRLAAHELHHAIQLSSFGARPASKRAGQTAGAAGTESVAVASGSSERPASGGSARSRAEELRAGAPASGPGARARAANAPLLPPLAPPPVLPEWRTRPIMLRDAACGATHGDQLGFNALDSVFPIETQCFSGRGYIT